MDDEPKDDAEPSEFAAGAASAVIIIEISADGEWVELVNTGEGAVDISGFSLADRVKDGTDPKIGEAAKFPKGTILSPRSYVVVQGGGVETGKTCPPGEQSYCVLAAWGISNKSGETLFFLAPDDTIVQQVSTRRTRRVPENHGARERDPKAKFVVSPPRPAPRTRQALTRGAATRSPRRPTVARRRTARQVPQKVRVTRSSGSGGSAGARPPAAPPTGVTALNHRLERAKSSLVAASMSSSTR